ncbi:hypothetical protein [Agrococcus casei]|uniref:hypothetical protein n=1 Tax=Agrococcus casei TaxID=343512 RepID=UPI003F9237A3
MERRYLKLASTRLFWEPGDPHVYPRSVDISVEPWPESLIIAEGMNHDSVGATMSVAESLEASWAAKSELSGGAWLIPYLERIRNGETVTEVELIAHFIMLHGREPEIGHIL